MGCSAIKTRGLYDGTTRATRNVADEVLDTLERWRRWGSRVARDTVEGVHNIRSGIFHYMEDFLIFALHFPR